MAMMTGTICARNLPQHFNGCTCTSAPGGLLAEVDVDLTPAVVDWRDQPVVVEGRSFTLGDVYGGRLFHGSPHEIADGDTLGAGRSDANHTMSSPTSVSITSGADIARHWASEAAGDRPLYVYEVEPVGPVRVWRAMLANRGQSVRLQEGRVRSARVLRRIDLTDAALYERALMHGSDPLQRTDARATETASFPDVPPGTSLDTTTSVRGLVDGGFSSEWDSPLSGVEPHLDADRIDRYARMSGADAPPAHVCLPVPGEEPEPMLLDGHHRLFAAARRGDADFTVRLHAPLVDADGDVTYPSLPEWLGGDAPDDGGAR